MQAAAAVRRRARADLVRLAHRGAGLNDFARRATRVLQRATPGEGVCLLTLDPATLIPTGEYVENGLPSEVMPRLGEIEQQELDFNKFVDLARRAVPAASLSAATSGELHLSRRQRELREPSGFADELRVTLDDGTGTWGALTLLRERGQPDFSDADVRFVASVANVLAEGVRRALLTEASPGEAPAELGLLLLAPDGSLELADQNGQRWLELLADDDGGPELPVVIRAVADCARRDDGLAVASARVRSRQGHWIVVRGSILGDGPAARVAIHLDAARAPELAPLLVAAYGFTAREREVTELVARGYTTNQIAGQLEVSVYTVQDHLKSIFEKAGTGSRGALVAQLFVDHQHRGSPGSPGVTPA